MNKRIKNATIITAADDVPVIFGGEIQIEKGIIKYVGENPPEFHSDEDIDAKGNIVMPGFVNAHTHLPMTAMRGFADDMELMDWLSKKIWPAEDKFYDEAVYWGSMLSLIEMAKTGTTTFVDSYFDYDWYVPAIEKSKIRGYIARSVVDFTPEMGDEKFGEMIDLYKKYNGVGNIRVCFSAHAQYTVSNDMLKRIGNAAKEYDVPMQIHVSETAKEHNDCIKSQRRTPIGLFEQLGVADANIIAAHCVHVSDVDMRIMEDNKITVASCPGSNLKLASGIARYTDLFENGINVALGTDGACSNNNLSMWEEMNLASLLAKGASNDPKAADAHKSIKMATVNGAKSIRLNSGTVEVGKNADLIMIDNKGIRYAPDFKKPEAEVVYSGSDSDVVMTMVGGEIIYKDGKTTFADEQEVIEKCKKFAHMLMA